MYTKNLAITVSALTLMLSAPASAFFIDDFAAPQQQSIESNGPTPTPNPTISAAVGTEVWATRTIDITLVSGAGLDSRRAFANILTPDPLLNFVADSGVIANYDVIYSGGDLASGFDFTEGFVLDHIAIDVLALDTPNVTFATIALSVELTDANGNDFTVTRNPTEVFNAIGGQVFFNLEDYDIGGVDLTEVTDVRLRIVSGSTARDGSLDNFRVVDRIPVPGSLLLLLPALALVKRRKG